MTATGRTRFPSLTVLPVLLLLPVPWETTCAAALPEPVNSLEPRCEFVAVGESTVAALTETRLLERELGTWLERTEIDRVLAEQELATSFAPGASSRRIALGQLLKADLLILLRTDRLSEDNSRNRIDLVVAETSGGLRILTHSIPLSSDPEADADKLTGLVTKAMVKYGETIREVYAVPPFLSRDLGTDDNHLMAAYAELMERVLLAQPGVLVVETAEAEAVSREVALTAPMDGLERPLPIYLWGEYRHDGHGDSRRISIRLETKRGGTVLQSSSHSMPPGEAPGYLERAAVDLLGQQSEATVDFDAETEARELVRRSGEFLLLRDWQQALTLAELSLLLASDQVDGRTSAILALHELKRYASPAEYMRLRRRAFDHLRLALECNLDDQVSESTIRSAIGYINFPLDERPELSPEQKRYYRIEQDYALKMAYHYANRADWEKSRLLLLSNALRIMSRKQSTDARLAFLSKYQHVMDDVLKRQIVDARFVPPKQETVRLWQTVLAWENVDEGLRRVVLKQQQYSKEAIARHDERLERKRKWESMPPMPPVESSALTFRAIEILIKAKGRESSIMPGQPGYVSLDDGSDVFWAGENPAYHVAASGTARIVWVPSYENRKLTWYHPVSDGRYLWIVNYNPSTRRHRLDVVEPRSRQRWRVTEEHGLPALAASIESVPSVTTDLQVAPLGHGEVVVAGYHGDTWLAHIRLDTNGKHHVNVFHEAKQIHTHETNHPLGDDHDNSCWNAHVAFRPRRIAVWTDPESEEQTIVVSRYIPNLSCYAFADHPLLVNPDDLSVSVMSQSWPRRSRVVPRSQSGQFYVDRFHGRLCLMHFEAPERPPLPLFSDILDGHVVLDGDTIHVVGREWQRGSLKDGSWQSLGKVPWQLEGTSGPRADGTLPRCQFELHSLYRSNLYGLVAVLRKRGQSNSLLMTQVLLDGSGQSFDRLSARW